MRQGKFFSFEGVDGAGKSTIIRRVAERLRDESHEVVHTREPGGSPGAEEIRALLVQGEPGRWSPETEALLFKAARRDHLERTILPALERGHIVLSDRFADSTRVYQGATRGDLRALVDALHELVIGHEPDLTIILDIDPETILERVRARAETDTVAMLEGRFEAMGSDFQQKLRVGFLALAEQYPERCVIVSAEGTEEEVFERAWAVLSKHVY